MSLTALVTISNARLSLWREGGLAHRVLGSDHAGLDFVLHEGEHTAIFGPNGAGKSTLLRLLRGEAWLEPNRGSIHWHTEHGAEDAPLAGRAMATLISAAQQEKYVRQGWDMSGGDLLLTGFDDSPLLYSVPKISQREAVQAMAEKLRMSGLLHRSINTLSQGQLRLLLLGRALLRQPALLLLDEYTDGLDTAARQQVLTVLEESARTCTIVMTSHRAGSVPCWVERRLYLENGRLSAFLPSAYTAGTARKRAVEISTPPPAPCAKTQTASPPLVEICHATVFVQRTPVLHDIHWTWRQGEHWIIHGGNGAGKSTFLRLLAGDEYPALGGSITRHLPHHGGTVTDLENIRRGVRLVSDRLQACYSYDLTGLDLVLSGFDNTVGLYRLPMETEEEEALRWMDLLRARPLARRRMSSLSTGQLRRLLLARALMGTPDLLLLDEPCSGLDALSRYELLDMLQDITKHGVHLALVSHHAADHISTFTRHAHMESGCLFQKNVC